MVYWLIGWEAQIDESDEGGNRYLRRLVLVQHENQDMVRDLGCRNQYISRLYSSHVEIKEVTEPQVIPCLAFCTQRFTARCDRCPKSNSIQDTSFRRDNLLTPAGSEATKPICRLIDD